MRPRSTRIVAASSALLVAAGLGAGGGAAVYATASPSGTTTVVREVQAGGTNAASTSTTSTVGTVYDEANKGTVEITVTTSAGGAGGQATAQGSGFVYDDEGHIVTNQHVVDGATSVSVTFSNGDSYDATVVGSDPSTDLAVIKVDAPASVLFPLDLGDSSTLGVGDGVIAIGSPFGLENTLTTGVVSALHRQMTAPNNYTINDSIQTDAAINHGNSGGPLLNLAGEVVGVNAQIQSESGGNDGVGFAIPSNTVEAIATQLIASGSVSHAYLGVSVETIPSTAASSLGAAAGVEVAEVRAGGPAATAGLKAATGQRTVGGLPYPTGGDVITAIDGQAVRTAAELQTAIDAHRPGETITITYVRGGETSTVDVKLAARPA
jgi:putative serine protease PepD